MPNFDDIDLTDVIMEGDPYGEFDAPELINADSVNGHTLGMDIPAPADPSAGHILFSSGSWGTADGLTMYFTSYDPATDVKATEWYSDVRMTTATRLGSLFSTLSKIANNVKYLFNKLGNHSVGKDVPSDAKFTDTTYPYNNKYIDANYKTQFRTQTKGDTAQGNYIANVRCNVSNVDGAPIHSSGFAFGSADTHGYMVFNYATNQIYVGAGNQDKLNWVTELAFRSDLNSYQPKLAFKRFQGKKQITINGNSNQYITVELTEATTGYTFLCPCGFNTGDRSISCSSLFNDATTLTVNNFYSQQLTVNVWKYSLWYK